MNTGNENKTSKLLILGAGGMAREVYQIYYALERQTEVCGFLINEKVGQKTNISMPAEVMNILPNPEDFLLINGIGSPIRRKWIHELLDKGFKFDNAIDPFAVVSEETRLGNDIVLSAGSIVSVNVKIGNHVIINQAVTISHDCNIDDFTTISPGVHLGGRVRVGNGTFLGMGSNIIQDVVIGSNVFVGAGSTVVENIPDNSLAYGSPAKVVRIITEKDWTNLI